jgi:chlorophyllide a reductase subunit X
MDDSFDFAVRLPEIGEPFRKLASDILNNAITPCEASGLDFMDFVRLFGEVSEELPASATAEELFRRPSGDDQSNEAAPAAATEKSESSSNSERLRLLECIEKLPEPEREVYALHEVEGKSPEQIAELTGLGKQEVKATLTSARKAMRKLFFEL